MGRGRVTVTLPLPYACLVRAHCPYEYLVPLPHSPCPGGRLKKGIVGQPHNALPYVAAG